MDTVVQPTNLTFISDSDVVLIWNVHKPVHCYKLRGSRNKYFTLFYLQKTQTITKYL